MRNWLAILTLTISVAFLGFGLLGISRWSDIETYREQMKSDADEASIKAKEVDVIAQNAK